MRALRKPLQQCRAARVARDDQPRPLVLLGQGLESQALGAVQERGVNQYAVTALECARGTLQQARVGRLRRRGVIALRGVAL